MLLWPVSRAICQRQAEVLNSVSLGPAAGNGLKPIRAEIDQKRQRLYVLNQQTRNLSVVDLRKRRVIAVVPLGVAFVTENRTRLLYDPVSDRVFISGPTLSGFQQSRILAISASRLVLVGSREVEGVILTDAVLLPNRHELFTSAWRNRRAAGWSIDVYDTRKLELVRRMNTPSEIVTVAANTAEDRIFTIEPDSTSHQGLGIEGPFGFGSVRITARDSRTGDVLFRSDKLAGARQLLVDSRHNRLLVPFSDQSRVLGLSDVIAVLDARDLSKRNVISFRSPAAPQEVPGRRPLFSDVRYDPARDIVVAVPSLSRFGLSSIDLQTGRARFAGKDGAIRLNGLAVLDPKAGKVFRLVEHGLLAYSTRNLNRAWSLPLGAQINSLLVDRKHRRALVVAQTDRPVIRWLDLPGNRSNHVRQSSRLPATWTSGFDHIIAADFARGWLYYTLPTIYGGGGYLGRMSLLGKTEHTPAQQTPAHLYLMALTPDGKRSFRAYVQFNTEGDSWVGEYDGEQMVRKVTLPSFPSRIVYAPGAHELFLLYPSEIRTIGGRIISLPPLSIDPAPDGNRANNVEAGTHSIAGDVSPDGKFAYYADAASRIMAVIRLDDGSLVASCRLFFEPSALEADLARGVAYLVDWSGGRVVTVRLPKPADTACLP